MLNKIKPVAVALVTILAITLAYTSCKKSENTSSNNTVDQKDLSLKLAKNFNDSFTANLSSGQKSSGLTKQHVNTNNDCGVSHTYQVNDSLVVQAAETSYKAKGYITLTTLCTTDQWTAWGYRLVDSISSVGSTIASETIATVKENYTATTTTTGVYGTVECNGIQQSHIVVKNKAANPVQTIEQTNNFILQHLVVVANDGNGTPRIQSGAALFVINGNVDNPTYNYNYAGTMTFKGNGIVNVDFGSIAFVVDLNTGKVTQQ